MPNVLADPPSSVYVMLGAMVVILLAIAMRRQKKGDVVTLVIGAIVFLAILIIDRAVESPREQVVRKIAEMGAASRNRNYDDIFKHISESFKHKSLDKKSLREKARADRKSVV